MSDTALRVGAEGGAFSPRPKLDRAFDPRTVIIFLLLLAGGLLYVAYSLYSDVDASGARITTFLPYLLLFVALLIALGFEFFNGFHDTDRGRDVHYCTPPAQIRTCGFPAYGSHLGCLTAKRSLAKDEGCGVWEGSREPASRSVPRGVVLLAAPSKRAPPESDDMEPEGCQCR